MEEIETTNQQQIIKEQQKKSKEEQRKKLKQQQNKQIKKKIKRKIITKILLIFSGCSLPAILCLFTVFLIIFLLLFNDAGLIKLEGKSSNNYNGSGECGFTLAETPLSKTEFSEKLSDYASKNSAYQIFADNANGIYSYAKSKNINPELVVIRAKAESDGTAIPAGFNYWGMGCTNTGGAGACRGYNSFQEGYEDFVNNISQYDSLKSMMSRYSYIGDYWYSNTGPEAAGFGGCYYSELIYENNMPQRVEKACKNGAPLCTLNHEPECVATTAEDQDAYANWQVKNMANIRKEIFGLEQNQGPCTGGLTGPLDEYNLNAQGLKTLESPLTPAQIEQLDEYIITEVNKAGYGTGNGVAAAGQSLVYWFEQQGVYLNYYWGGGHGSDSTLTGANKSWGSNPGRNTYNPNTHYGMDCSGFVSWAIRNGCNPGYGAKTTHYMNHGRSISVNEAKPGDIMLNPSLHVRLVVKNNGNGTVITAEETSGKNNEWGLIFTQQSVEAGYSYIDMSNYYKKTCETSR